jgi:pantetheine-phosphate adenylyltransferase
VTKGHLNLISRAAALFDHVTVVVMVNISKRGTIPAGTRVDLLGRVCDGLPNVSVEKWDGLLADYMAARQERIVVRGIRGSAELDHELQACAANRMLNGSIETVFLPCDPQMNGISSSAVREIAAFGGDIRPFVPDKLTEEIRTLLSKE